MSEVVLFQVVGHPHTGKTTLIDHLRNKHRFISHDASSLIKEQASARDVSLSTRFDFNAFGQQLQKERGLDWITDEVLRKAEEAAETRVVHSSKNKFDFYRTKNLGGCVVALVCPPEICFARRPSRDDLNDHTTFEEYLEYEKLEESEDDFGTHTDFIIREADFRLDTSMPLEQTLSEVDLLVDLWT